MSLDVKAPGLIWRELKSGYEARWVARPDLVERGWRPKSQRLGCGWKMTEEWKAFILDRCLALQNEMNGWAHGRDNGVFNNTLPALVNCYQTDPDSNYKTRRYQTRLFYAKLCEKIGDKFGETKLAEIKARDILAWHRELSATGHVAMPHALIGMMRTLVGFGKTILENKECERLSMVLHAMRFPMAKPRDERLTLEMVTAVIAEAHRQGLHSLALAQAIQFEIIARQKDILGEWVPVEELGVSDVTSGRQKWLYGIRWSEIDANLVLRHITSKRQKPIEVNLRNAPLVMAEFATMGTLPTSGPVVVSELTGIPWHAETFRPRWRKIATAAGVPKNVRNMDSRAGAISEATDAGAELEHVRHAATHSDISMTQRYSRGGTEKTANVQHARSAHRSKNAT